MADQQETIDQPIDSEIFESAIGNDAQEQTEQVAEATGQPRDENGRFAAKTEVEPPPAATEAPLVAESGKEGNDAPPSWRLREMREERDAERARAEQAAREAAQFRSEVEQLRRQMTQNAPKPEPVDIFADPNAWAQQQLSPIEQRMQSLTMNLTLRASRAENVAIHGRDTVNAAEKAIEEAMRSGDPEVQGLRAKMLASDDPVGVAVDWHQSRSLLKETGGDLKAYREKVLEEAMKDPAFQARVLEATRAQANGGNPTTKNIVKLPPSLSRLGSAGNDAADNDMSDGAIFAHALR